MSDEIDEFEDLDYEQTERLEERRALTPAGIERQNFFQLQKYRDFRSVADLVVEAWCQHSDVASISVIGSVARAPWKEVPRFQPYRRKGIELWHECGDLDLAVWLYEQRDLDGLRKAKNVAVAGYRNDLGGGVASHQVDAFLLDAATSSYLGRLCQFNRCPKRGKMECLVPGCGSKPFLKKVRGFQWRRKTIAEDRCVRLFDRSTGLLRRASSLPLPNLADEFSEAAH